MAEGDIRRIFEALDILRQQNARVEALLQAREKICEMQDKKIAALEGRVSILEKSRSFFSGGFGFAAWAITTALTAWSVMHK
nr:MAG TPA: hypothetical protein [Caudoviricetes sp.]